MRKKDNPDESREFFSAWSKSLHFCMYETPVYVNRARLHSYITQNWFPRICFSEKKKTLLSLKSMIYFSYSFSLQMILNKAIKNSEGYKRKLFRKLEFPLLSQFGSNTEKQNQSIQAKINVHNGAIRWGNSVTCLLAIRHSCKNHRLKIWSCTIKPQFCQATTQNMGFKSLLWAKCNSHPKQLNLLPEVWVCRQA